MPAQSLSELCPEPIAANHEPGFVFCAPSFYLNFPGAGYASRHTNKLLSLKKEAQPFGRARGSLVRPKLPPPLFNIHRALRDTRDAIIPESRIYYLILRQSCIKQQSVYEHWPFDVPKQGVHPSAVWIQWISSVFFILPGFIPRPSAFFLILGISISIFFFAAFVANILHSPFGSSLELGFAPKLKFNSSISMINKNPFIASIYFIFRLFTSVSLLLTSHFLLLALVFQGSCARLGHSLCTPTFRHILSAIRNRHLPVPG